MTVDKKVVSIGMSRGNPGDQDEQAEIACHDREDDQGDIPVLGMAQNK